MENLTIKDGVSINSVAGHYYSTGDIIILNSDVAPDGFLPCDGQTISQSVYPDLYSFIGTYYDAAATSYKLPNLNQNYWIFPCGTVGNESGNSNVVANHTHTSSNSNISAQNYSSPSHTHNVQVGSSYYNAPLHNHGVPASGNSVNVASNLANRSNGAGQGVNLAVYGHVHAWGSGASANNTQDYHSHNVDITTSCQATTHTHSATLTTSNTESEYILENVILMRYYIKW